MRLVLVERDKLAALDGDHGLHRIGLRPGEIVAFMLEFRNPVVDESTRGFFDRRKIAALDTCFQPRFLLGMKCYRHGCFYHKSSRL